MVGINPNFDWQTFGGNALQDLGYGLSSSPTLGGALGQATQRNVQLSSQRAADAKQRQQTNATVTYLRAKFPQLADAVENGGMSLSDAWSAALAPAPGPIKVGAGDSLVDPLTMKPLYTAPSAAGGGSSPSSVQEYQYALSQGYKGTFEQWRKGASDTSKYGNTPVMVRNGQGNWLAVQPGSDGSTNVMHFPDGFQPDPGSLASDRAAGAGYGALQGPAQFNLPKTQQDIETELGHIDALLGNTTGMDQSFGNAGGVSVGGIGLPNQWLPTVPNTPKAGFQAQLSQVQGENFLAAYATLRGAGAITETEGQQAQAAMARLSTAQSKGDFTAALAELKGVLKRGYDRMTTQTKMGPYQSSGYTPPTLNTSSGDPELDKALQQYGGN